MKQHQQCAKHLHRRDTLDTFGANAGNDRGANWDDSQTRERLRPTRKVAQSGNSRVRPEQIPTFEGRPRISDPPGFSRAPTRIGRAARGSGA